MNPEELTVVNIRAVVEKSGYPSNSKSHRTFSILSGMLGLRTRSSALHPAQVLDLSPETGKHVPDNESFLSITFPMLVHSGRHFRVIGRSGEPVEATHTPLFTSRETPDGSTPYVVDFVAFNSLDNALAVIKTSFDAMVGHLGKYFTE